MTFSSALYSLGAAACVCVLLAGGASAKAACEPSFSRSGPDAEAYGAAENYPLGTIADR
ncbi:MAG TPA: serine hydrolase, partial [Afipia sp.]|nr:serine hydrolase [Afipia sp.]